MSSAGSNINIEVCTLSVCISSQRRSAVIIGTRACREAGQNARSTSLCFTGQLLYQLRVSRRNLGADIFCPPWLYCSNVPRYHAAISCPAIFVMHRRLSGVHYFNAVQPVLVLINFSVAFFSTISVCLLRHELAVGRFANDFQSC